MTYSNKIFFTVLMIFTMTFGIGSGAICQIRPVSNKNLFFKEVIDSFRANNPMVLKISREDNTILFFEENTYWGRVGFYCYSDLDLIKKEGRPDMLKRVKDIPEETPLIIFNNQPIVSSKPIPDIADLLPSSVSTFKFKSDRFVMISLNLVSFMGTPGWSYVLLKIGANGKVSGNYYFESQDRLMAEDIGDFNGDGNLDYIIKYKTIDSSKNIQHLKAVYSIVDHKKLH